MKPGDVKTGEVTITNTGSLAGTFKVAEGNASNAFAAGSLHLKIEAMQSGTAKIAQFRGRVREGAAVWASRMCGARTNSDSLPTLAFGRRDGAFYLL